MQRAHGCGRSGRAASGHCCLAQGPAGGRATLHKSALGPLEARESLWPQGSPVGSTCCPRPPEHVSLFCLSAPWLPRFWNLLCCPVAFPLRGVSPGREEGPVEGRMGRMAWCPAFGVSCSNFTPEPGLRRPTQPTNACVSPARIYGSDFHVHHDAFLLCEGSDSTSALGAQCEPMTAVSRELRAHSVPRPSRALPLPQGDTLPFRILTLHRYNGHIQD